MTENPTIDAVVLAVRDQLFDRAMYLNEAGRAHYTPFSHMYVRNQECAVFGRVDGAIVGVLFFALLGKGRTRSFEINVISVDPLFRGRGVGSAILDCALRHAAENDAKIVRATVKADNAASLALMRKYGFQESKSEFGIVSLKKLLVPNARHLEVMAAVVDLINREQLELHDVAARLLPLGYAQVEIAAALTELEQTRVISINPENLVTLVWQ